MAERLKALVLKTSVVVIPPWVRIPLSPPIILHINEIYMYAKIFLFDIDGTLVDSYHRQRHLKDESKTWDERFDTYHTEIETDKPIPQSMEICSALFIAGHRIIFFTARSDCQRQGTVAMLAKHLVIPAPLIDANLIMRPIGDRRDDATIKTEMYDALSDDERGRIYGVFEDIDHLVKMWREKGLYCYQVVHEPIPTPDIQEQTKQNN